MTATPHELPALLLDLGEAGIELATHPTDVNRLRHRPAVLPLDIVEQLRMHRAAVLGLLVNGYAPDNPEAAYIFGERLGIADDSDLPTHIGSPAWLVAVGESIGVN